MPCSANLQIFGIFVDVEHEEERDHLPIERILTLLGEGGIRQTFLDRHVEVTGDIGRRLSRIWVVLTHLFRTRFDGLIGILLAHNKSIAIGLGLDPKCIARQVGVQHVEIEGISGFQSPIARVSSVLSELGVILHREIVSYLRAVYHADSLHSVPILQSVRSIRCL
jgi:hypothetical protein